MKQKEIEELKNWREELDSEINELEDELKNIEEELERIKVRHSLANKAYRRSNDEFLNEEYLKPLYQELQDLQQKLDRKTVENRKKVYALNSLIDNIDTKIKVNL
ncbi:hypothetical protein [Mesobacillus sp. S13]|uniref:hypothetical protein n=1 Tax=Mesobacillus sp. S13 TaxID=2880221 RepID=UPI001CF3CE99|nr:hypothetical protein [Mesobacillus sp. S13]